MKTLIIKNNQTVPVKEIPELTYPEFMEVNLDLMKNRVENHCVNYYGYPDQKNIKLICCIADDELHQIHVSSCVVTKNNPLPSFTARNFNFEKFEREIHENFQISYIDHPWLKPLRFPHNRADKSSTLTNYPFLKSESEELHEVGVGPIHAGIIEPGHFRFICSGERIIHLEIQLGYQHRGIESLFIEKKKLLERTTLAENIAGDTTVGHTTAFVNLWESLLGFQPGKHLQVSRTLALELERIAIHTGDLSALCTDIAYQLGNSVYGRLRTPVINYFQEWCGNRLAKSLIRAGKANFTYTHGLGQRLIEILNAYEPDFDEMSYKLFRLPSALSRFERTGEVKFDDVLSIGTVGMAARASGLNRDIRNSHPHDAYLQLDHKPVIKNHGDVYSRVQIRKEEIKQSIAYIRQMLKQIPELPENTKMEFNTKPNSFTLSMVEGWRGEICHSAITDDKGELKHYKIKDPSFHNWMALALAVRNHEISDFPVCNKSFNLSYCGHDL